MKNNTNPPFSLFREYVKQLMDYGKKFIIIGNKNAITYKEIFPYIKNNELWLGCTITSGDREFKIPEHYVTHSPSLRVDENGNRYLRVPGVCWFTNLSNELRNTPIDLYKRYSNEYPHYENYDAINVDKVTDIPVDYNGIIGVPVTFLFKYCPEQFEIVGSADANVIPEGWRGMSQKFVDLYYAQGNTGCYSEGNRNSHYILNGKAIVPYKRILIRKIK